MAQSGDDPNGDEDALIVARHMLDKHQALAVDHARARASALFAAGNTHGSEFWSSVVSAIEKLRSQGRG